MVESPESNQLKPLRRLLYLLGGFCVKAWQVKLTILTRMFHELLSRDQEDGRATGQLVPRYRGIGSEAYLNGTSQGPTPEDARKDGHIRGRSK